MDNEKELTKRGALYLATILFAAPWLVSAFLYGIGNMACGWHFMRAALGG